MLLAEGSASTRYTYTGREADAEVGLMYYRARWYDPQLGRFLSEDPIGLDGGMNMYSYVGNNPINFNDPSGLCIGTGTQRNNPVPCKEQDFNFKEGANGLTAEELRQIAQTAVGEASFRGRIYYPGEASAIIDTILNRLSWNLYGDSRRWAPIVLEDGSTFDLNSFSNRATTVAGILGDYDAHRFRSGERKLAQEKALNNGILPADSYVCKQLIEAKENAQRVGEAPQDAKRALSGELWH